MSRAHGKIDWHWVGLGGGTASARCSQCGSLMPERAAELLRTPGTAFASSEWSYGWPDRVLLDGDPFFAVHVAELADFEVDALARLMAPLVGAVYLRDAEGALDYRAVRRGFRTRGRVGDEHAPTEPRPPREWIAELFH